MATDLPRGTGDPLSPTYPGSTRRQGLAALTTQSLLLLFHADLLFPDGHPWHLPLVNVRAGGSAGSGAGCVGRRGELSAAGDG